MAPCPYISLTLPRRLADMMARSFSKDLRHKKGKLRAFNERAVERSWIGGTDWITGMIAYRGKKQACWLNSGLAWQD
ncbi:hypothetical protein N7517_000560 [Penicillium concentricum]|uniref:Uncharacterized protein n=1 Tax=Penicillium concentricum TaxID=293559 RepID=A0A9W9SRT7_9EURO|nr:uncharacterized protein N7517_000560 [Penicillium concentricum]KAJ5382649.1 hypothetical protein N7517_000560 [Penicillium concentricum]